MICDIHLSFSHPHARACMGVCTHTSIYMMHGCIFLISTVILNGQISVILLIQCCYFVLSNKHTNFIYRFYPQLKLGHLLLSFDVKVGDIAFSNYFQANIVLNYFIILRTVLERGIINILGVESWWHIKWLYRL